MVIPRSLTTQTKAFLLCISALLTACTVDSSLTSHPTPSLTPYETISSEIPTQHLIFTPSPNLTPTSTSPVSPTSTPALQLCSPLEGLTLSQLAENIVNPFHPPQPGSDQPHQGVDLAELRDGVAVAGLPIRAVLAGIVAAVIPDRFPYGNAILIETPLKGLPPDWVTGLDLPDLIPNQPHDPALTCPGVTNYPDWSAEAGSLYLLYAHMQQSNSYQQGDAVACGDPLGIVGDSGNALNPHLHLEARVGPPGARFSSLAHYDTSASLEEMDNYCTWRVSGWFMLLNPMPLLEQQP